MPILPIMDLLILAGWSLLSFGAVLKAIYVTTNYRPTLLGLGPMDCAIGAGVFLLFALALAARTWVKQQEASGAAERRARLERGMRLAGGPKSEERDGEEPDGEEPDGEEPPVSSAGGRG